MSVRPTIRLDPEAAGGLIVALIGSLLMWWTFYRAIPTDVAIVPRLACGAIAFGGATVLVRSLLRRSAARVTIEPGQVAFAVAVLASLALYGWMMLVLGLASASFLFLIAWWLLLYWRKASEPPSWRSAVTLIVLAAGTAGASYALFILFLDMYLPDAKVF